MTIPRKLGIPFSFAGFRAGHGFPLSVGGKLLTTRQKDMDHVSAFAGALGTANSFIARMHPNEFCQVVADDTQEMKRQLRAVEQMLANGYWDFPAADGQKIRMAGDHLMDEIHFMDKSMNSPVLEIADAVAYGLRAFYEETKYADRCKEFIFGSEHILPKLTEHGNLGLYLDPDEYGMVRIGDAMASAPFRLATPEAIKAYKLALARRGRF
jgi:hypothetical protein